MTIITDDGHVWLECHRPDGSVEYVQIDEEGDDDE